ncbi:MAG: 16S rRNA (adenine(1518)-N(6)/adenine(1519)-N(6))-dimethyltransferase RsmA [Candidatus Poribacteria bacterium]|nr:16S rRNA (adenine(1518)-N(6)/adenine(1519)-N(6))-dimethyltransferase RsmA [Candidatus Poribacteria bacterium]
MTYYQLVREFLNRTGTRPRKRLGQNFLIDPNVLEKIVAASEITDADSALEIGAGLGFLTSALALNAKRVIAIEVDNVLFRELQCRFTDFPQVRLIHGDVLKVNLSPLLDQFSRSNTKVIANLPYSITTPIIWKLLSHHRHIGICVLMMQREVADRIAALPDRKTYGALTVGISYYAETEIVDVIPPDCFYPAPQVESAIVKLKIRDAPKVRVADEALFFRIIRASFQARRKMLRNALLKNNVPITAEALDSVFDKLEIDPRRRGETLEISEFAALANGIAELTDGTGR